MSEIIKTDDTKPIEIVESAEPVEVVSNIDKFKKYERDSRKSKKFRKKALDIIDSLPLTADDIFALTHLPIDEEDLYNLVLDMEKEADK